MNNWSTLFILVLKYSFPLPDDCINYNSVAVIDYGMMYMKI